MTDDMMQTHKACSYKKSCGVCRVTWILLVGLLIRVVAISSTVSALWNSIQPCNWQTQAPSCSELSRGCWPSVARGVLWS